MKRSWWKAILEGGVGFLVLVLWCNIAAWAQVAPAPVEEAAEKEARPEEVAKPPPLLPEEPGYIPGILPPYPYATLKAGPTTGVLAPYGYAPAYDTLLRGWRAHRVGPVLVSPYLEYNGIYRSNIYQTSTDKRSDFVNAVFPGLRLELPVAGRHKVSVGYLGNYFIYSENDRQSHYDHNVNADIAVNFRGGLSLRLGNTFRAATEERTAETGRQRDYRRLNPYFLATYAFADRWKLQGSYLFDYLDFAEAVDRVNEYREHTGGLTLYYKFWPKTSALVQYIITAREYPFSPRGDNVSHSPLVGLTWDPTAKLTGTVKFGYTVKKYDRDLPGRDNSPDSWAMSLQTLYRYSRYTTLTLTAQRSIQEDVDLAANNAYRNTAVYVSWNHEWHYFRSLVYLTFGYSKNHYLGPTLDPLSGERKSREDDLLSLGGGLSRPFTRFFRVRLDYQYLDRSSNLGGFSYNEHRFLCGIQASL
jgi:hypothetical protein